MMYLSDTLSLTVVDQPTDQSQKGFEEINMVSYLPIREERLAQIQSETEKEGTLQLLKHTTTQGCSSETHSQSS